MDRRNKILVIFLLIVGLSLTIVNPVGASELINMNFKGADIRDVLRTIAELADVNLVTDGLVQGDITIHLKDISFKDALSLITNTSNLAYKWYDKTVVVATPEKIDELYSNLELKTITINYAVLTEVQSLVKNMYPELNIVIDQRNSKLIMKGKSDVIKDAEKLILKLDTPQEENIAKIIPINYDNMDFLVKYINKVYPELVTETDGSNVIFYGSLEDIKNAKNMIKDLAEQLSAIPREIENKETKMINIRFADVEMAAAIIKEVAPNLEVKTVKETKQIYVTGTRKDLEMATLVAEDLDKQEQKITRIKKVSYSSLEDLEGIITELYPEIKFKINKQKREIIFNGKLNEVNDVLALIAKVDLPRQQVIIEAWVEEMNATDARELGVNPDGLSYIKFNENEDVNLDGVSITFPEFLKATNSNSKSNTLANPRLMTLSGEKAKMLVGDRIPVVVEEVEDGVAKNTVQYIEAGITLEFLPWVTEDGQIILEVSPKVDSINDSLGTQALPGINTNEVETKIRLKDGQTFAIGGLIRDDVSESISKIPLLGDLPLLGALFSQRSDDTKKKEIIIFITPHIVEDKEIETLPVESPDIEESDTKTDSLETQPEEEAIVEETEQDDNSDDKKEIIGLTEAELEEILEGFEQDKKMNSK